MPIDWSQGFRIESDGTSGGTKVYDSEGNLVVGVKEFLIRLVQEFEPKDRLDVYTIGDLETQPPENP